MSQQRFDIFENNNPIAKILCAARIPDKIHQRRIAAVHFRFYGNAKSREHRKRENSLKIISNNNDVDDSGVYSESNTERRYNNVVTRRVCSPGT